MKSVKKGKFSEKDILSAPRLLLWIFCLSFIPLEPFASKGCIQVLSNYAYTALNFDFIFYEAFCNAFFEQVCATIHTPVLTADVSHIENSVVDLWLGCRI